MQGTRQEPNSIEIAWTRVDLSAASADLTGFALSAADRGRTERFRQPADRVRFVLGRALLAGLLRPTGITDTQPLQLALTEQGKPFLPNAPDVHFSITHAGGVVAVALTHGARVGIDVEELDRSVDLASLAERIFDPADLAQFNALAPSNQPRAFFHAWTGKEAILKAKGLGLFGGLQEISVPFEGADRQPLFATDSETSWRLHPLPLPSGYIGFVACDDPARNIGLHEFDWRELLRLTS